MVSKAGIIPKGGVFGFNNPTLTTSKSAAAVNGQRAI
jgi:hypothetical protein